MIITTLLVVFMILVFVLVFLFIRTIDKRKWLTLLVSLVLTPLVYFYMFYPFLNIIVPFHHQKHFNSEAWTKKPGLRYEMVKDITDSKFLIGKDKSEIEALLGKYEWLSWDDAKKQHDENLWNYGMGLLPGAFNDDKECLTLVFKNDKVFELKRFQEQIVFEDE
ncbi:hypothetical protein RM697_02035 [Ichthyenterobacterium sp. W332]|uniref:Uncharacterized protein n=1 Tax=Microcosmobacter mediterraneus TaxID=3075607 RepID=A0ABU2YGU9_9FLAO|nr:hypothetical protein [Ichthyenterobacterium sp. W332]MDT0557409.1 hypothetical protein [Ichthyenterobacterium sp. W332]